MPRELVVVTRQVAVTRLVVIAEAIFERGLKQAETPAWSTALVSVLGFSRSGQKSRTTLGAMCMQCTGTNLTSAAKSWVPRSVQRLAYRTKHHGMVP